MATFITSKTVGQKIIINVNTSTGYWKYNHNGSDSSVFSNGSQTITVANANGEFTIIPCNGAGTVDGNLTTLNLNDNQLTSFDGTGLSSLTTLDLGDNPIPALVNDQILADLVKNGISFGYLGIDGSPSLVRTTASNDNFTFLTMDLSWTVNGTYSFPSSGLGKIRVKGITQI